MNNMLTDLEEYFKNTSREKFLQDWKEAKRKSIKTIEDLITLTPEDFVSDIGYIIAPDTLELERLAKNSYMKYSVKDDTFSINEQIQRSGGFLIGFSEGFIVGAKWEQERSYSEEEVLDIIDSLFHQYASLFRIDAKEYFLQFKKK